MKTAISFLALIAASVFAACSPRSETPRAPADATATVSTGVGTNPTGAHVARSEIGPALTVNVSPDFRFVDSQRFVLFENSNAEQHVFVDQAKDGSVRRLIWIQFESYLPAVSETYDYSSSQRQIAIGGVSFFADSAPRVEAGNRPGSDAAHLAALLGRHGLRLPQERLWQRLVHVSGDARSEVMVIYLEDLAPLGAAATDLSDGGSHASRWPAMADALLERARSAVSVARRE